MSESNALLQRPIGELVAEDFRRAEVFRKYGIDFCCGGGKRVEEVCSQKGLDPEMLLSELSRLELINTSPPSHDFLSWSPEFLSRYIEEVHHRYVREKMPLLLQFSQKVAKVHGAACPETIQISHWIKALDEELSSHMAREENILFPYIRKMWTANQEGIPTATAPFGTVNEPISVMVEEHDEAGNILREIRTLSRDYQPPEWACNTFKVLYQMLEAFEHDLHLHIHLENNILFPKSIQIEEELRQRALLFPSRHIPK